MADRVIVTRDDADAIRDEWVEFVDDWLPTMAPEGRMESGGWEELMDKGERYLNLDLGSSMDAPGYKRLLNLAKQTLRESVA